MLAGVAWWLATQQSTLGPPDLPGWRLTTQGLWPLQPLNRQWFTLPWYSLALWPPGGVLLLLAGLGACLRRPGRLAGLPVALVSLHTIYVTAGHGPSVALPLPGVSLHELGRYAIFLLPATLAVAAVGWSALPTRARLVVTLACFLPPLPEVLQGSSPASDFAGGPVARFAPQERNPQRELHALAGALERSPDCAILTLGVDWTGPRYTPVRWVGIHRNAHARVTEWTDHAAFPGDPEAAARALFPHAPCAVAYLSEDSARAHTDTASQRSVAALRRLARARLTTPPNRPWLHPTHEFRPVEGPWSDFVALPGWRAPAWVGTFEEARRDAADAARTLDAGGRP